jgi:hypothetical protein
VAIDQPGLHATGERLAYTESDAISVLSGVPGTPAKVVTAQGTSTGAAFRFHAADATSQEKIEALGATDVEAEKGARGTNQRVHTESRVSKERKSGPTKN